LGSGEQEKSEQEAGKSLLPSRVQRCFLVGKVHPKSSSLLFDLIVTCLSSLFAGAVTLMIFWFHLEDVIL